MKNAFKKHYYIIIPLFTTLVASLFHGVFLFLGDDYLMMHIAQSASYNAHSELLMFINVLIGYILKPLYLLLPAINWLTVLYVLCLTVSVIVLNYCCKDSNNKGITATLFACFQLYILANLTFTSVAFITALAGILLILDRVEKLDKKAILPIIVGVLLLFFGIGLRSGQTVWFLVLAIMPMLVLGIKNKSISLQAAVLVLVLAIGLNFGLTAITKEYKKTIPADSYYTQFQAYRSATSDAGLFNYEEHRDTITKAGLSENDYNMISKWTYADKDVFTAESLEAIAKSRDFNDKFDVNPLSLMKSVFGDKVQLLFVAFVLLLTLLVFLAGKEQRTAILLTTLMIAGAVGYLHFRRRGLSRITSVVMLCGASLLLYLHSKGENADFRSLLSKVKINPNAVLATASALVVLVTAGFNYYTVHHIKKTNAATTEIASYLEENAGNKYVGALNVAGYFNTKYMNENPYLASGVPLNCYLFGSSYIYSYTWYADMEQMGYGNYTDNALEGILLDEDTYLVSSKPDIYITYFNEHYPDKQVNYTVVHEFASSDFKIIDFNEKQ